MANLSELQNKMSAPGRKSLRARILAGRFVKSTSGLATVEWVALAAAMVIGAVTIAWLVMTNVKNQAGSVGSPISGVANTNVSQPPP